MCLTNIGILRNFCILFLSIPFSFSQTKSESLVGMGWSGNSINTVIFRNNALTSFDDYQFTAYYNQDGYMVLAKRMLDSDVWENHITKYKGNVKDAHNSISIVIDNQGFLHVSWDQHNTQLRYATSKEPMGLELTDELEMTGLQESKVTYPEFHNLPNGNLLFMYRSGESGRGNTILNEYNIETKKWQQIQSDFISGENLRSAYWQTTIDTKGNVHISWVWRETWDVASNHDLCYAISKDGGLTWEKSTGEKYQLPITHKNAEVIYHIPQHSNLINQTSMVVDSNNVPYVASYWSSEKGEAPQYKVVHKRDNKWQLIDTKFHNSTFSLSGGGTKKIPFSRPKILVNNGKLFLLFRDEERGNKITLANTELSEINWRLNDISNKDVGQWEPNYDLYQWQNNNELHIFSQRVLQEDQEGITDIQSQPISIIELKNFQNE